jgi:hypothetical protein
METLFLWLIATVVVISTLLGFLLGRFAPAAIVAWPAILTSPFLILLAVAGALESMIVVETYRKLAQGRMIDGEALGFFIVAYLVATVPAVIGGAIGRALRGR